MMFTRLSLFAAAIAVVAFAPAAMAQTAPRHTAPRQVQQPGMSGDAAARRAARIERMFKLADKNRDNALSRTEYSQWYKVAARRRGPLTWRRHASQMFRQLDVAQKGRITIVEFARDPAFRRTRPGWSRAVARALGDDASRGSSD